MQSLWNDEEARSYGDDPLQMRVYTSRLLGRDPSLVLHGGGNTSVKSSVTNALGDTEEVLYVKGSGWDLATIEAAGFAPVRIDILRRMAELETLSDSDMVRMQRAAMTEPSAPNPSVEAILHAVIPACFVDHTHADAVVTITNTPDGEKRIRDIYGDRVLIVPYVMPGFILAKTIFDMTRDLDWQSIDGMVLLSHGVFTFHDDARESYEQMIRLVSEAESYLASHDAVTKPAAGTPREDLVELARIRVAVSRARGAPMIARLDAGPDAVAFSDNDHAGAIANRGPLTPDHVLRTKRVPVIIGHDPEDDVAAFGAAYDIYFDRFGTSSLSMLDPAPRWAVWKNCGVVSFGNNDREAEIVADIVSHTMPAICSAEALGGWQALGERDIFDVEYWELEQAKLKKTVARPPLSGKIAVVTGAAGGIGKACVEKLHAQGAAVVALDVRHTISALFDAPDILGLPCDVTSAEQVKDAIASAVRRFGGIDILVNNAGVFPDSEDIAEITEENWELSLTINLTAQQVVLRAALPYLTLGIDPAVVFIASKNVPAPGRGAAAYSVAKAGLTQLARVAALELGPLGVRVNILHPNNVFDTGIWTPEVLEERARRYGMAVEDYKKNNVLGVEVTSADVAELVCSMVGPAFAKVTGAQVPIDGGNERVI
jgi:rhamnose utilization protein RhaD (predicted bifunctional aldolase and dehydrogenase)/NAD(P)-dependent dehydrogenase (short-subunit alcohol dehydrogenase family)